MDILCRRHAENPIKRVTPGILAKRLTEEVNGKKKDIQRIAGKIEGRRKGCNYEVLGTVSDKKPVEAASERVGQTEAIAAE